MIRLNRLTDYAVVILGRMGRGDDYFAAPQLALTSGVPLPTVAKVLKQLTKAKLVLSHRGVSGGYSLARPPEQITVAEIITALEGPIALTACVGGTAGACEVETSCPMRGNWDKVNGAIYRALEEVTLADIAEPSVAGMCRHSGPALRPLRATA